MATDHSTRAELGEFLRSRRERLEPEVAGFARGRRRRTPGLRREEVAELAGIGVDWYTRLEQGRDVSASPATLEALARALRMSNTEASHLRTLARATSQHAFVRETVPAPLVRLVALLPAPAYVTGRRWDLLAWNRAAVELFGDFARLPESERNILIYMLTEPAARRLFGSTWADEAERMVAQFRSTHDLWAGDPAFVELLQRLYADCPNFSHWWEAHDVRCISSGRKTLHHPQRGVLCLEYASLQSNDDAALRIVVYTPADGHAGSNPEPIARADPGASSPARSFTLP